MAGMAVTQLRVKQSNLGLQSSQWGQPLGDVLVTPANSPPSHSPHPWPSTPGPHTLAYQACFYRKNGFEGWRLGVVLAQAQTAPFHLPNPFLPAGKDTHQSGTVPQEWKYDHTVEKRAGPALPPCHPVGEDRVGKLERIS